MKRLWNEMSGVSLLRWSRLMIGLICFGIGIAFLVHAKLGLAPWEVLNEGLSFQTGIRIGTISMLIGVPILLLWIPIQQRPGIGTLLNIVVIGNVTNLVLSSLPMMNEVAARVLLFAAGVLVLALGSALYLSAQLGAGPRDGLMMGLSRRTGWSVRTTRTVIEVAVLVVGWLLGGTVGVGTLAFAFLIGPAVQLMFRVLRLQTAARA